MSIVHSKLKKQYVSKANRNLINIGNLGNIKSESSLKKRHKNDLVDLFLCMEDHQDYSKQVSNSFNVHIYSREQLSIAHSSKERILFFDSTGTLVRKREKKKILYYCGLLNLPTMSLCPIVEMSSCQQDSSRITDFLTRFIQHFCQM